MCNEAQTLNKKWEMVLNWSVRFFSVNDNGKLCLFSTWDMIIWTFFYFFGYSLHINQDLWLETVM